MWHVARLAMPIRWTAVQSGFAMMDATEQLSDHRAFLVETLICINIEWSTPLDYVSSSSLRITGREA